MKERCWGYYSVSYSIAEIYLNMEMTVPTVDVHLNLVHLYISQERGLSGIVSAKGFLINAFLQVAHW